MYKFILYFIKWKTFNNYCIIIKRLDKLSVTPRPFELHHKVVK